MQAIAGKARSYKKCRVDITIDFARLLRRLPGKNIPAGGISGMRCKEPGAPCNGLHNATGNAAARPPMASAGMFFPGSRLRSNDSES